MALIMDKTLQLNYFKKLFGPSSPQVNGVSKLIDAGYTVEVLHAALRLMKGSTLVAIFQVSVPTTAIVEEPHVYAANKKLISTRIYNWEKTYAPFVEKQEVPTDTLGFVAPVENVNTITLTGVANPTTFDKIKAIKVLRELSGMGLKNSIAVVESLEKGTPFTLTLGAHPHAPFVTFLKEQFTTEELVMVTSISSTDSDPVVSYYPLKPCGSLVVGPSLPKPLDKIHLIKAIRQITGLSLKDAKERAEQMMAGIVVELKIPSTTFMTAEDTKSGLAYIADHLLYTLLGPEGVIESTHAKANTLPVVKVVVGGVSVPAVDPMPLRQAQALNQPVFGTSAGSIYYSIAVSDNVRVAAKLTGNGALSVRAEWSVPLSDAEKTQLVNAGFKMKGEYASMHIDHSGVPSSKVLGSLIWGLGVKWTAAMSSATELKVG